MMIISSMNLGWSVLLDLNSQKGSMNGNNASASSFSLWTTVTRDRPSAVDLSDLWYKTPRVSFPLRLWETTLAASIYITLYIYTHIHLKKEQACMHDTGADQKDERKRKRGRRRMGGLSDSNLSRENEGAGKVWPIVTRARGCEAVKEGDGARTAYICLCSAEMCHIHILIVGNCQTACMLRCKKEPRATDEFSLFVINVAAKSSS